MVIAYSCPQSIDDSETNKDWNWKIKTDMDELPRPMSQGLHYTL
jgi:hypothetical protein